MSDQQKVTLKPQNPTVVQAPQAGARGKQAAPVQRLSASSIQRARSNPAALTPANVQRLQGMIGNSAVQRLLAKGAPQAPASAPRPLIQPKLKVGPVGDQYEEEANLVASQVMRQPVRPTKHNVQRQHEEDKTVQKKPLANTITPLAQRASESHGRGCSCPQCAGVQRKAERVARDGSFEAGDKLSKRVRNLSGKGAALPQSIRREMEPRFGADFGGVRIHTGAEGAQLSRQMSAQAFTHGQNIAFASGKFSPNTASGKQLLAHELTHTIQQNGATALQRQAESHGAGCSCPQCSKVQRKTEAATKGKGVEGNEVETSQAATPVSVRLSSQQAPVVQRHSTHEHYLLGTLTPEQLSDVPLIRQQVEQANMSGKKFKSKEKMEKETSRLRSRQGGIDEDKRREVMHILEQEMKRLLEYQDQNAMQQLRRQKFDNTQSKIGKVEKIDEEYQVPLVEIPAKDGESVVCTYGELNTLADMFGTIEDMSNSPADAIIGMLQGVRQRVYIELYKIYHEIGGRDLGKETHQLMPGTSFEDVIGFSGKEKPKVGALKAVKGYEAATMEHGEFTEANATAALARNACHFAPETWYTWRRYHEKAKEFAHQSHAIKQKINEISFDPFGNNWDPFGKDWDPFGTNTNTVSQDQIKPLEKEQKRLANQALLYSGFGDHYLQDAYASGHLIDKTKVMQWFFEWQKSKKMLKNTPGYAMIAAIVEQDLQSNPQMIENVQGGLGKKVQHMGVQVKDHISFLIWWRNRASIDKKTQTMTAMEALDEGAGTFGDDDQVEWLMAKLEDMGFATSKSKKGVTSFTLKQEHIDVVDNGIGKAPYRAMGEYEDEMADDPSPQVSNNNNVQAPTQSPVYDETHEFYYQAYAKFLDKTHLQLITNFLHNKFCSEGLVVETKGGDPIGRIYGDTAMISAGAQSGVEHSATTAKMARESIYSILDKGFEKHTTQEVDDRFPRKIRPDWKNSAKRDPIAIDDWWKELKLECIKSKGLFAEGTKWTNLKSTGAKRVVKSTAKGKVMKPLDKVIMEHMGLGPIKRPTHDPVF